jgi:subtilase family serine protease
MAGIAALLNENFQSAQGALNPRLYQLAANPANAVFHDVTVASSGVSGCVVTTPSMCNNSTPSPKGLSGGLSGYLVTPGFDEVTGLGSIDGANLLANWMPSVTAPANPH